MSAEDQKQIKNSFIFYRSFFEAIEEISDAEKLEVFMAICQFSLNFDEPKLSGISKAIFTLIKPQLSANQSRWDNGCKGGEHGIKGGRPKTPKKPQANPKKTPSQPLMNNENENVEMNNEKEKGKEKFVIPNFILAEDWNNFLEMREKKKKPPTEYAIKLILSALERFENKKIGNGTLALQNSIKNSWLDVFEPKDNFSKNTEKISKINEDRQALKNYFNNKQKNI